VSTSLPPPAPAPANSEIDLNGEEDDVVGSGESVLMTPSLVPLRESEAEMEIPPVTLFSQAKGINVIGGEDPFASINPQQQHGSSVSVPSAAAGFKESLSSDSLFALGSYLSSAAKNALFSASSNRLIAAVAPNAAATSAPPLEGVGNSMGSRSNEQQTQQQPLKTSYYYQSATPNPIRPDNRTSGAGGMAHSISTPNFDTAARNQTPEYQQYQSVTRQDVADPAPQVFIPLIPVGPPQVSGR
jgi:hypothetical protein